MAEWFVPHVSGGTEMLQIVVIVISVWIAVAVLVAFVLGRAAHLGKVQHAREVQAGWDDKRPVVYLPTPVAQTPAATEQASEPTLARLG